MGLTRATADAVKALGDTMFTDAVEEEAVEHYARHMTAAADAADLAGNTRLAEALRSMISVSVTLQAERTSPAHNYVEVLTEITRG